MSFDFLCPLSMNSLVIMSLEPYYLGSDADTNTAWLYDLGQGIYFSVPQTQLSNGVNKNTYLVGSKYKLTKHV